MDYPVIFSLLTFFVSVCFGGKKISFTIKENIPSGTPIGNIAAKANLSNNLTSEEFESIIYSYIGDNKFQDWFGLDNSNGDLQTSVYIDREEISDCKDIVDCVLELSFVANSGKTQFVEFITASIHVEDINDHSPVFPQTVKKYKVSEASPIESRLIVPPASDEDVGINGIKSYEIHPATDPFELTYTQNLDGSFLVQIVQKGTLDREKQDSYIFQVIAKDGGEQQNIGRLNINISVLDINDNPPIFNQSVYNVTVREDVAPNNVIVKISANDPDKDENGQVSYQFRQARTDLDKINQLFSINSLSGEITLLNSLVYNKNEQIDFIVEASDHGASPQISQVKVNIIVQDVGNNRPVVKINLPSAGTGGVVSLPEATNIDNFVAHVNVEDSDTGNNGNVSCYTNNQFFAVQKLPDAEKAFKVVIRQKLDRETTDAHSVKIICHDFGTPQLSAEATFNVSVTDDNDNDPRFLKSLYEAFVDENATIGNPIVQLSAEDDDIGVNAAIQYFLHSDAGTNFAINSYTGVISVSSVYDRETQPSYFFHVLAVDNGDPTRTGTASVSVTLRDINDNSPIFNKTRFTVEVYEGQPSQTFVGLLEADDRDSGQNGLVSFSISKDDEFNVPFIVLSEGTIRTRDVLDREKNNQYSFKVFATDHGIVPRSSSATVTVKVLDINDNEPIISFPRKGNNSVTTSVTTLPVTTITARDIDSGVNKKLVFYIYSGNEANMFYLNPESGELFLNRQYHFTRDKSQSIRICVQDSGTPVLSNCADLSVSVIVSNATSPTATSDSNKYITISIVVVIVTLLISAAIILTIYFLKKIDRNRQEQKFNVRNGPLGVPMQNGYSPAENSAPPSLPDSFDGLDRKQKGVSFSTGSTYDSSLQRSISSTAKQEAYLYDRPTVHHNTQSPDTNLQALQLKQILLKNNTESETSRQQRPHPSDNHSDSSGETVTSDSGRGGSEDEVPGSTLDESRSFEFQYPSSYTHNQFSYSKDKNNMYRDSDKRHMPRPLSYNIKNNSAKITNSLSSSQPYLDNSKEMQYHSWDFLRQSAYVQYPRKDRDYFNLRPESLSTLRSRDDDDDAATTTSGSYTINPEELEDDLFQAQKDLVV